MVFFLKRSVVRPEMQPGARLMPSKQSGRPRGLDADPREL
jgi:hypothetical protein